MLLPVRVSTLFCVRNVSAAVPADRSFKNVIKKCTTVTGRDMALRSSRSIRPCSMLTYRALPLPAFFFWEAPTHCVDCKTIRGPESHETTRDRHLQRKHQDRALHMLSCQRRRRSWQRPPRNSDAVPETRKSYVAPNAASHPSPLEWMAWRMGHHWSSCQGCCHRALCFRRCASLTEAGSRRPHACAEKQPAALPTACRLLNCTAARRRCLLDWLRFTFCGGASRLASPSWSLLPPAKEESNVHSRSSLQIYTPSA